MVGLGNPGERYASTRHNLGFMVVDRLADRWNISLGFREPAVRVGVGKMADHDTMLVQPQLYMNVSGDALSALPELCSDDLVIVYDDVDLARGRLRLRRDGGSGGHRGVASVIESFGPDFDRVRVGIGRPPQGTEVPDFVLQPMSSQELQEFEEPIDRASDAVEQIVREGITPAMNRFNSSPTEPGVTCVSREEL